MKIFLAVFLCLFFGFNIFGQSNSTESKEEIGVEEITLARDDGSGKAGEITDSFLTTDVPIHCFVQLDSIKTVVVKIILVAVKVIGLKPESKVVTISYKTNGTQNGINFNASPEKIWAAGTYRADVLIDGKLAKSLEFEIKKSSKQIANEKQSPPKPRTQPKTRQKSRKS